MQEKQSRGPNKNLELLSVTCLPSTPIQRMSAMMSSIWYSGWMKSPCLHSLPEKENTLMVLMLRGMRAPIIRVTLIRPVTRVTTLASSSLKQGSIV